VVTSSLTGPPRRRTLVFRSLTRSTRVPGTRSSTQSASPASTLRKRENHDVIRVCEWRDPDSNRGHHDSDRCSEHSNRPRSACKSPDTWLIFERAGVAQLVRGCRPDLDTTEVSCPNQSAPSPRTTTAPPLVGDRIAQEVRVAAARCPMLAVRPRQSSRQRGVGRLLAHGSRSGGRVRELSVPDVPEERRSSAGAARRSPRWVTTIAEPTDTNV
jgi:hypothetical protein